MLSGFDFLREFTFVSVLFRLLLAMTCGGITGKSDPDRAEYRAMVLLRPSSTISYEDLMEHIRSISGVKSAELIEKRTGERLAV